jgi:hypothetical protein
LTEPDQKEYRLMVVLFLTPIHETLRCHQIANLLLVRMVSTFPLSMSRAGFKS